MIRIVEQKTVAKCTTTPSEDAVVVTSAFAAVIDGATPKTSFRYPGGETPGHLAARLLSEAIAALPAEATAFTATLILSNALTQPEDRHPSDRPIASCIIYSATRRELWMLGDCQCLMIHTDGSTDYHTNPKLIDRLLAEWRRAIINSSLSRGLTTPEQIMADDPGRRIIQPFITRQVYYQNRSDGHRLAYCMLDGQLVPQNLIRVIHVPADVQQLVLASDGYPVLKATLAESEAILSQLLLADPLCIGPLLGTKGLRPGNQSFDDRSYLRIRI